MADTPMSTKMIYLFMGLMVLTGSINTIMSKLMQTSVSLDVEFVHQKFITSLMFLGETICLFAYYITKQHLKKKTNDFETIKAILPEEENNHIIKENEVDYINPVKEKEEVKVWYLIFPAFFDLIGSTLMTISLTYLATSIYQMCRGGIVIFTALGSYIFLKRKLYRHNILGISLVAIGLIVVGLNAVLNNRKGSAGSHPLLGIILIFSSQIFVSAMLITEEVILHKYDSHPLKVVGWEGIWGTLMYVVILTGAYFIRCDDWTKELRENVCQINDKGEFRLEDTLFAFKQIEHNYIIGIYASFYGISIAVFNYAGATVTKNVSSTARTIVDTMRTVLIWVFFLIMPFVADKTKETFSLLQLSGFIILIAGSVIYNEIIIFSCCGFDRNLRKDLSKDTTPFYSSTDTDANAINSQ